MDAAGAARKGDLALALALTTPLPPSPSGSSHPLLLPAAAAAALVLALPAAASRAPAAGLLASPLVAGAMDGGGGGGGEALLVRRSKGKKRPPQEREPGGAAGGDTFRALWRDYHDLLEETEAKKRRLAGANRRKLSLLAEIKFLRRKYNSFVKYDDSQQTLYKLKKQARKTPTPVEINEASAFADLGVGSEMPSTSKTTHFDLNQDTIMNREGLDRQGHQCHSELDKFDDQIGVDEDTMAADVKLSVCRDTGNSPASDDKRTISWQDRLALRA